MKKTPLSVNTKVELAVNAGALALWALLAVLGAVVLDWRLEKNGVYDALYENQQVPNQDYLLNEWGEVIGTKAGTGLVTLNGHKAAHGYDSYYSNYYGGEIVYSGDKKVLYPQLELNLLKVYMLGFAALLWLTPLSPRQWLVRRRRILLTNRKDYAYAQGLGAWLEGNNEPFSAQWEVAGVGISLRPISIAFHTNADMLTSQDGFGRSHAKSVVDPLRLGFTFWGEAEDGQVWRVVGLSTDSIRQFVVKTIETWVGVVSPGTHLGQLLKAYSFGSYKPEAYATLNQVVKDLDRSIAISDRKPVNVRGPVLDKSGLMLATSIGDSDQRDVFLPVPFLRELAATVQGMTGRELPAPNPADLALAA